MCGTDLLRFRVCGTDLLGLGRYPSCSLFEYQSNTCPAAARPDFYQETRFIYVADSGKNEPEKRRKKEEKNGPSVR